MSRRFPEKGESPAALADVVDPILQNESCDFLSTPSLELQIAQAVSMLRAGTPVAIPTETVYGLAAPIDQENALREVFRLKERPFFDPLIVHISTLDQLDAVATAVSDVERELMKAFWPGPCTFILQKQAAVSSIITSGLETVAVRMPSHPVARAIIDKSGVPLAAPSANKFGRTSPTEALHVKNEWPGGEVFVVDSGSAEHGLESTVLRVAQTGPVIIVEVLRPGVVTSTDIENVLRRQGRAFIVRRAESSASPGHTEHHYMPKVPLVIVPAVWLPLSLDKLDEISAELGFQKMRSVTLELSDDPRIAARELYGKLHTLSESGAELILFGADSLRQGALWDAIWDRIGRAATKRF